ncbi:MAG: SUMF1/EgtB/PvdO family nonheme iron enzyme [Saprospiraceae bacterium]|nr:SUMF1/EgtB/PvdO family nonheme iron enzyme [Saprospiraceae bacterium]
MGLSSPTRALMCVGLMLVLVLGSASHQRSHHQTYRQALPGTDLTIEMVAIPGGTFTMGSPETESGRQDDEGPAHEVSISPFWMSKVEITWDLYSLFMERDIDKLQPRFPADDEVSLAVDGISGATTPYTDMSFGMGTDGFPAVSMTHHAASTFCAWLSAMTGRFYRLPTEAEWEYACRAGSTGPYHCETSALDAHAWHQGNSGGHYHRAGAKRPNAWGLHDMHGNVAEWTLDQYHPGGYQRFAGRVTSNPYVKPDRTYPRVVRGGSWKDDATRLRSAARLPSDKRWKARDPQIPKSKWWHTDASFVGFRIVRPVKTPSPQEQRAYWGM